MPGARAKYAGSRIPSKLGNDVKTTGRRRLRGSVCERGFHRLRNEPMTLANLTCRHDRLLMQRGDLGDQLRARPNEVPEQPSGDRNWAGTRADHGRGFASAFTMAAQMRRSMAWITRQIFTRGRRFSSLVRRQ